MQITLKRKGVNRALLGLSETQIRKAERATVRRAAGSAKTIISSIIRDEFNIKKKDLDDKIKVNLGGLARARAELILRGRPISLVYFGPRWKRGGKKPLSVEIHRGKKTQLKRTFLARGTGGTLLVFRRLNKISTRTGRQKLKAKKSISYPSIVKKTKNSQIIYKRILDRLEVEWKRNINYYHRGHQKGGI